MSRLVNLPSTGFLWRHHMEHQWHFLPSFPVKLIMEAVILPATKCLREQSLCDFLDNNRVLHGLRSMASLHLSGFSGNCSYKKVWAGRSCRVLFCFFTSFWALGWLPAICPMEGLCWSTGGFAGTTSSRVTREGWVCIQKPAGAVAALSYIFLFLWWIMQSSHICLCLQIFPIPKGLEDFFFSKEKARSLKSMVLSW